MSQRDAHESYAVAARRLHWIAAILAASLAVIVLLMYLLAHTWWHTGAPPPGAIPPEPRLQRDPAKDLAAERRREQAWLDGYAWVDRDAGIARIPIGRALDILARSSSSAKTKPEQPR
jgi:hypothetical protein